MIELLLVVGTLAILFAVVAPRITTLRASTQLRAGRQQLTAAFAAARVAALQKGKLATLTLSGSAATVSVLSGLTNTATQVFGPIRLDSALGVNLVALSGAPTTLRWNGRGLLTPAPAQTLRYQLTVGTKADTVCLSTIGLILPKGCAL